MIRVLIATVVALGELAAAQTVFVNANIYTVDEQQERAEAIAIDGGRIVAVGSTRDALAAAGAGAEVIDVGGATIVPGLIDGHGHIAGLGGLFLGVIDLSGTSSYDQVIELVQERAGEVEPGAWILGRGWDHESWPEKELPTHHALSEATPQNQVWLSRVDGQAALANALAIEAAAVTARTASP
mgnify:CR=1 FL=1